MAVVGTLGRWRGDWTGAGKRVGNAFFESDCGIDQHERPTPLTITPPYRELFPVAWQV